MSDIEKAAEIAQDLWRLFPDTFAHKLSQGRWKPFPWLKYLSRQLTPALIGGGGRFIVEVPPRHGKSEFMSHWIPMWYLSLFPYRRIILASYAQNFANRWGRKVRNGLESFYGLGVRIDEESRAANRFDTTLDLSRPERGGMITSGVGGQLTGEGANLFIVDDPIKNWEDAMSDKIRSSQKDWWLSTARTRFEPGATAIILQTRWHEDDLAGWLQRGEDNDLKEYQDKWTTIRLPALAEESDPLGRLPGEALCPERYSVRDLMAMKASGEHIFSALFQQRPFLIEGSLFKRAWWRYFEDVPDERMDLVQFWDCAQKVGLSNDYSVCATWLRTKTGFFLIDLWRGKVEAPELQATVQRLFEKWRPNAVVIEDKSSGSSLIQYLRRSTSIPVIPYDPKQKNKEVRASMATPSVQAGLCHLPKKSPWLQDFLSEHERFPNDVHDDMVDTTSMMVEYFNVKNNFNPRIRTL